MWGWIFLWLALPIIYAGISLAPWVPTRKRDIERLQDILKLQAGERFLEIGCGDARVCRAIAQKFPHNEICGIELAFPIFLLGYLRNMVFPQKNLTLKLGNALKQDFWNYDVIYIFGMPEKLAAKVLPKFLQESKKGSRLISYVFSLPENPLYTIESFGSEKQSKIHIATKL